MLPHPVPTRGPRAARGPAASEPTGLVPALVLLGFGLTALCGVAALLLIGRLPAPAPLPDVPGAVASGAPTATPEPAHIVGGVWDDACLGEAPSTPACVLDSGGRYRANGTWDAGESGLPGVLVTLGVGACPAAPALSVLTAPDGAYRFGGLPAGTYCVSVDPAHGENVSLVPGGWTWPVAGAAVASQVTLRLEAGQTGTVNFGWDRHEEAPTPEPQPGTPTPPAPATATLEGPSPTPGCSDHAAFMADVTIPDQAVLPASAPFVKTWRLLNTGTCSWGSGYALVFNSGEAMGSPGALPLTITVAPGGLLELSVSLTAPPAPGPHEGTWVLRGQTGDFFGTGPNADVPLRVRIVVSGTLATTTPTALPWSWQAEYFANRDLAGAPAFTRTENAIDHDWGLVAPGAGVPPDNFSARWTGSPIISEDGTYRLTLTVDDGARLWVEGELVLDDWREAARREVSVEVALAAGARPMRLEFFDREYEAVAKLRWERVGPYPYWQGEYWANDSLNGAPALTRQETRLDFAWGNGSPAAEIPADHFSARWTRTSDFGAGAYRFRVTVDDGARLWVDDQLVVDAWAGGAVREVTGEVGLAAGPHTVRVEFVEYIVEARLAVRWEKIPALSFADWKAEYWANPHLQGTPALVRNDRQPGRDWGQGAPAAGLPEDNFSIRWTRALTLEAGLYRFRVVADDGVRVRVGNLVVIDEWHPNDGTTAYQAEVMLSGPQVIVIEYYDSAFAARLDVQWERLTGARLAVRQRPTVVYTIRRQ